MNKDDDGSYTLEHLLQATRDLEHHRSNLRGHQDLLKSKRNAIKSFEEAEAAAALAVQAAETQVRRIAARLSGK